MKFLLNKNLKCLMLCCVIGLFAQQATAQFTITENFRSSHPGPDVILGDGAKLTSGDEDPEGAGWLRLTSDATNQKGYAYINKSFPSTLGVLIDFEYTMWRTKSDSYNGADGLSIFLFDADYGPGNFHLGAYGGSLGYANSDNAPTNPGLTGGYLGIGFDAFGNFANSNENKNGGSNGERPNSITFRGPTTGTNTNDYLKGVTIYSDGTIKDAINNTGVDTDDVIDYNTVTSTRPDIDEFYRRVQIEIRPTDDGKYKLTIFWTKTFGGDFVELMSYTTSTSPPPLLKLGFAASTGAGFNNHELRNIRVTTLGDLRVTKNADVDILRSQSATSGPSNEIEYAIDVTNDTDGDMLAIDFGDTLTNGNGEMIDPNVFEITSITTTGFDQVSGFATGNNLSITNGHFEGTLSLKANSTGKIIVHGKLSEIPEGNLLNNTTSAFATQTTDFNLQNNTATVSTPVVSEKADLVITNSLDQSCLDKTNGNEVTLTVTNVGNESIGYGQQPTNKLTVQLTLPNDVSIQNTPGGYGSDWSTNQNGNDYTFTKSGSGSLNSLASLPPITFTLEQSSGTGYTIQAVVSSNTEVSSNPDNTQNNETSFQVDAVPNKPGINVISPIMYWLNEPASPLYATPNDPNNTLLWSLNKGGVSTTIPYTPNTSQEGTQTYYVQEQTPGGCLSDYAEIKVKVKKRTMINTNPMLYQKVKTK